MDEKEMQVLVKRITQEVLHRLRQSAPRDEDVSGTVALVSSFVPSKKSALKKLKEVYGAQPIDFITFGTQFTPLADRSTDGNSEDKDIVLEKVAGAANIVIVTPKISVLKNIAEGNDEGFVEHLAIRSLLWGRNVSILLDFAPPRFKRNTFLETVVTVIGTLEEMGMKILDYKCAAEKSQEGLALVTEQDILDAYKNGQKAVNCMGGALVTPLAADKAKELGVKINY